MGLGNDFVSRKVPSLRTLEAGLAWFGAGYANHTLPTAVGGDTRCHCGAISTVLVRGRDRRVNSCIVSMAGIGLPYSPKSWDWFRRVLFTNTVPRTK